MHLTFYFEITINNIGYYGQRSIIAKKNLLLDIKLWSWLIVVCVCLYYDIEATISRVYSHIYDNEEIMSEITIIFLYEVYKKYD